MKKLLFLLLFLATANVLMAQGDDCHPHFKGSDKSDFEKGVEAYNNKRYQRNLGVLTPIEKYTRYMMAA